MLSIVIQLLSKTLFVIYSFSWLHVCMLHHIRNTVLKWSCVILAVTQSFQSYKDEQWNAYFVSYKQCIHAAYYILERRKMNQSSYSSCCSRFHTYVLILEHIKRSLRMNRFDNNFAFSGSYNKLLHLRWFVSLFTT